MIGCLIFTLFAFLIGMIVLRVQHREKLTEKRKLRQHKSKRQGTRENIINFEDVSPENEVSFNQDINDLFVDDNKYCQNGRLKRRNVIEGNNIRTMTTQQPRMCLNSKKFDKIFLLVFPLTFSIYAGVYVLLFVEKFNM